MEDSPWNTSSFDTEAPSAPVFDNFGLGADDSRNDDPRSDESNLHDTPLMEDVEQVLSDTEDQANYKEQHMVVTDNEKELLSLEENEDAPPDIEKQTNKSSQKSGKLNLQQDIPLLLDVDEEPLDTATVKHEDDSDDEVEYFNCERCTFKSKYQFNLHKHNATVHGEAKFSCNKCNFVSARQDNVKRHIKRCRGKKFASFPCDECHKVFNTKKYLNKHKKRKLQKRKLLEGSKMDINSSAINDNGGSDETDENYDNPVRGEIDIKEEPDEFQPESYVKTEMDIVQREFPCDECDKVFHHKKNLVRHKKRKMEALESKSIKRTFSCEECGKAFLYSDYLKKHIKRVHEKTSKSDDFSSTADDQFIKTEVDDMDENIDINGDCITKDVDVRNHRGKRERLCVNYKEVKDEHLLQDGSFIPKVTEYQCELCEYKTPKKWYLKRHVDSIHLAIKYDCPQCDYKATRKSYLAHHIASVHEGVIHNCDQCDYTATNKRYLIIHKESVHEGIKHDCNLCEYKGATKLALVNHIKNFHVGVRFYCDQCDYSSPRNYTLVQHVASKHQGVKYECQLCDYKANDKLHLTRHVAHIHKKCEYCDYQPIKRNDLKKHRVNVHGELLKELGIQTEVEKPYLCYYCDKGFAKHRYLKQHFEHMHKPPPLSAIPCAEKTLSTIASDEESMTETPSAEESLCSIPCAEESIASNSSGKETISTTPKPEDPITTIPRLEESMCTTRENQPIFTNSRPKEHPSRSPRTEGALTTSSSATLQQDVKYRLPNLPSATKQSISPFLSNFIDYQSTARLQNPPHQSLQNMPTTGFPNPLPTSLQNLPITNLQNPSSRIISNLYRRECDERVQRNKPSTETGNQPAIATIPSTRVEESLFMPYINENIGIVNNPTQFRNFRWC